MSSSVIDRLVQINTVRLNAEWTAAHTIFSELVYPNRPLRRDYNYLAVKLVDRKQPGPNLWLAINGDRVVGQLGLIEVEVCLEGSVMRSAWGVNLVVLPEFLGAGYGGLLELRALLEYPVYLGFGVSEDSARNQAKRGASIAAGPRMAYSVAGDSAAIRKTILTRMTGLLLKVTGYPIIAVTCRLTREPSVEHEVQVIADWLSTQCTPRANSVRHDFQFYKWRLIDPVKNANRDYRLLYMGDSYVLIDRSARSFLADFHFSSVGRGLCLIAWACAKYQINRNPAPVFVNLTRDVFVFLLLGFLVSPKRQPVFINGWKGKPIRRFFMSGLDGDVSI